MPGEELKRRDRLQAYLGSGEHAVWSRVLDDGGSYARLRLDAPLPLAPGDRLVLRDPGSKRTVAGAEVLDVDPTAKAKDAPPRLALSLADRLLAGHPWLPVADLPRLGGLSDADAQTLVRNLQADGRAEVVDRWLVAAPTLQSLRSRAGRPWPRTIATVPSSGGWSWPRWRPLCASSRRASGPHSRPAAGEIVAVRAGGELVVDQGVVRDAAHAANAAESPEARELLDALDAAPFAPPAPADVGASPALVRTLTRDGQLTELDGVVFSTDALERARALVVDALRERGTLTVADVRDVLGSTRKFVVPIVTWLDRTGVTRRRGDDRIPGPTSGLA